VCLSQIAQKTVYLDGHKPKFPGFEDCEIRTVPKKRLKLPICVRKYGNNIPDKTVARSEKGAAYEFGLGQG
jgi:hypothetical protein